MHHRAVALVAQQFLGQWRTIVGGVKVDGRQEMGAGSGQRLETAHVREHFEVQLPVCCVF